MRGSSLLAICSQQPVNMNTPCWSGYSVCLISEKKNPNPSNKPLLILTIQIDKRSMSVLKYYERLHEEVLEALPYYRYSCTALEHNLVMYITAEHTQL